MNIYHFDNRVIHIHNVITKTKENIIKKAKHFKNNSNDSLSNHDTENKNNFVDDDFIEIDNVYKQKYIDLYETYQREKEEQLKALENLYNYIKEIQKYANLTDTALEQSLLEAKNIKKEIDLLKKELADLYK